MALTRKFLASKGIEADVIDEIIEAHTETVNGLKDKIEAAEKYKGDAEKVPALQEKVKELEKIAQTNGDYDALKKEFDDYKAEIKRKVERTAKETAYKDILKDAGIPEKHFAKILKYSDVDGVELDKDGKITTAKDILASIKEEWGDHIETTEKKGADTSNPPKNAGGGKSMTKDEIFQIKDSAERQKAILENREAFGF
jgi:hypothetical protein